MSEAFIPSVRRETSRIRVVATRFIIAWQTAYSSVQSRYIRRVPRAQMLCSERVVVVISLDVLRCQGDVLGTSVFWV